MQNAQNIPEILLVKGGSFFMGDGKGRYSEKPEHKIIVDDFGISKYPITVAQFAQFVEESSYITNAEKRGYSKIWQIDEWLEIENIDWRCDAQGYKRPLADYNHPVVHITWIDALEYCKWLSKKTGEKYHLPTEAQWEYAAAGGNEHQKWAGTDNEDLLDNYAWFGFNNEKTIPVGQKKENLFGMYDMSGNVWEWCRDDFASDFYKNCPVKNPLCTLQNQFSKVVRGGAYNSSADDCTTTRRMNYYSFLSYGNLGFRIALLTMHP
jgi:formylglycine-generating enzyme required for sulfatase activity